MTNGREWTRDVDTAIALYELVGAPTPVDGDRRPQPSTERECDTCDGVGLIWVPVGELSQLPERCWKCGGKGTLEAQPTAQDHVDGGQ